MNTAKETPERHKRREAMKPVALALVVFVVVAQAKRVRDGDYEWTLPATIEALRDVMIRTEDVGRQDRATLYVVKTADAIPTKVDKGVRFQMTRIDGEGECTIRLGELTLVVSSCHWLAGFTDHEEDVYKVISGRSRRAR